jgi:predicted metal-dependent enzyme (double-stranded beta helix superfamily)
MLPVFATFIEDMRGLFTQELTDLERWTAARGLLQGLMAEPDMQERARRFPSTGTGAQAQNLLFYEDPDYGFVVNALVKDPGRATSIHDHGQSWTVYGVLEGGETIKRYQRTDDGEQVPVRASLAIEGSGWCGPGDIDFIEPWQVHAEFGGPERTVGLILRSQRSGTFVQNRFLGEEGDVDVVQYEGPEQIPYVLS